MKARNQFLEACEECDLPLSDGQLDRAGRYLALLRKWNQHISLTSVEDDRALIRLHFVEAFWCAERLLDVGPIADVGSGAGFPGLAAKLYRPDLNVTLLERSFKKCVFLERATRELELDVTVVHGVAEDWSGWPGARLATLRALHPEPSICAVLQRHHVRLVQFRGPRTPAPRGWRLVREEHFPLSDHRTVAIYAPAGDV